jgi:hypothetical protein
MKLLAPLKEIATMNATNNEGQYMQMNAAKEGANLLGQVKRRVKENP